MFFYTNPKLTQSVIILFNVFSKFYDLSYVYYQNLVTVSHYGAARNKDITIAETW